MEFIQGVTPAQFEFFAIAAVLSALLFSLGFALGRTSRSTSVNVPVEVIHALASARFANVPARAAAAAPRASNDSKILHEIEELLHHVEHEKDFGKAKAYAIHELDRIMHDHGASAELKDLHHKVEAAHNKGEIEKALHHYIDHHH